MTPRLIHANRLDGAWWPRSADLITELPPLLHAVSKRIGRIRGVLLNQDEWLPTPVDWTPAGNHRVRIGWYGHQEAHMAVLIGDSAKRVDLLVIPSGDDPTSASAAMTLATAMGNTLTGPEALHAASVSGRLADQQAGSNPGGASASISN
ncbi:MAG: hypothetical protein DLM57_13495 [Pseudonocardiales bacterium]|nr:MAG: hypothetical protein DLM57_13495 [Pseudonocardiales bacterium]